MKLEALQPSAEVRSILFDSAVTAVNADRIGIAALDLADKTSAGTIADELLFHQAEPRFEIVEQGRLWSAHGNGALSQLVAEAQRIRVVLLRDPVPPFHASALDPLRQGLCRGGPALLCSPIHFRSRRWRI